MGEIDGETSVHRFGVYRAKGLDICGDVSDGDIERIRVLVKIDCIVKVLCRDGVDGTKRKVAQILSLRVLRCIDAFSELFRLFKYTFVKFIMPVKQSQRDQLIDKGVIEASQMPFDKAFLVVDLEDIIFPVGVKGIAFDSDTRRRIRFQIRQYLVLVDDFDIGYSVKFGFSDNEGNDRSRLSPASYEALGDDQIVFFCSLEVFCLDEEVFHRGADDLKVAGSGLGDVDQTGTVF